LRSRYYCRQSKTARQNTLSSLSALTSGDLAHEFMVTKIKRDLEKVNDPAELRQACLMLIDLMEKQKQAFKQLMGDLIESELGIKQE
jgi:hypothetical protein